MFQEASHSQNGVNVGCEYLSQVRLCDVMIEATHVLCVLRWAASCFFTAQAQWITNPHPNKRSVTPTWDNMMKLVSSRLVLSWVGNLPLISPFHSRSLPILIPPLPSLPHVLVSNLQRLLHTYLSHTKFTFLSRGKYNHNTPPFPPTSSRLNGCICR